MEQLQKFATSAEYIAIAKLRSNSAVTKKFQHFIKIELGAGAQLYNLLTDKSELTIVLQS